MAKQSNAGKDKGNQRKEKPVAVKSGKQASAARKEKKQMKALKKAKKG